jgi:uroporphyrinogen-III synthase
MGQRLTMVSALSGKTILITRPANHAHEMIRLIEESGGNTFVFPTIEIKPPITWDSCDKAIDGIYMFDGIAFTSINSVEFFFRRFREKGLQAKELNGKIILVVGAKTKQAVEDYGLPVTIMPEKFTAQDLANMLRQDDLKGKSFLFPKGNLAKDTLPATLRMLGADIEEIIVYQTIQPNAENIKHLRNLLSDNIIDVVTFTSPSTVKNFFYFIPKTFFPDRTKIAVIGPTTAQAVEELGYEVDIQSENSTIENLVESISNYFLNEIPNNNTKIK